MIDAEMQKKLKTFLYHKVTPAGMERMAFVRKQYYTLGQTIIGCCPESRCLALALTALEESLMRAIQSIAHVEGTSEE